VTVAEEEESGREKDERAKERETVFSFLSFFPLLQHTQFFPPSRPSATHTLPEPRTKQQDRERERK
jgi:hypothetical protein